MDRPEGLLRWQWKHYRSGHRDRTNLLVHLVTVPFFMAGTVAVATAALTTWWTAPVGMVSMALAVGAQGRTHRREAAPQPFKGPLDVVARLFVEQWITFPRYLLSGELSRAWREQ
jgi:hypothetical protein